MGRRRGRGEGGVYRRPDGRWAAILDLGWQDGKRQRRFIYGRTRAEAIDKLRKAQRAREDGIVAEDARTTVGDFLGSWLTAVKPNLRPSTWQRYEQYVRLHVVPELGRVRLSRLTPQNLQRLYARKLDEGLSRQSVVHVHRTLHRALSQGVRWGLVGRNVAALVDPPRVERPELEALTLDETQRLLLAARGDRLEALYVLALTTGLRRGELLGLRWSDVDLRARTLRVRHSLQVDETGRWVLGDPKTKRSRRPVLLTEMAITALTAHRERQDKERVDAGELWRDPELVFTNTLGGAIFGGDLLKRHFYPLLDRAGLRRVRFHDLRHGTATLLLACGVHPKIVSEMLGHSHVSITLDLYSHATETMQRQASDALQDLLGSIPPDDDDQGDDDEPP